MRPRHLQQPFYVGLLYFLASAISTCLAAPSDQGEAKFLDARREIEQRFAEKSTNVRKQYADWLGKLLPKYQEAGDLDNTLALSNEIKRIGEEQKLESPPELKPPTGATETPNKLPAAAVEMQSRVHRYLRHVYELRVKETATLLAEYSKHLKTVQDRQVKAGDAEDAALTKTKIATITDELNAVLDEFQKIEASRPAPEPKRKLARVGIPLSMRQGLILHLGFDRDEKDKVTDKSGQGHHANVNGATWTAKGIGGGGIEFIEPGSSVSIPSEVSEGLKRFSISLWVKSDENGSEGGYYQRPTILGNGSDQLGSGDFGIVSSGGCIGLWHGLVPPDDHFISEETNVCDGEWRHVVIVSGEDGVDLYVDAALETRMQPAQRGFSSDPLALGASWYSDGVKYAHSGVLDEVMLWDRPLSSGEIKQLFRAQNHLAPREASFAKVQPKAETPVRPSRDPSPAAPDVPAPDAGAGALPLGLSVIKEKYANQIAGIDERLLATRKRPLLESYGKALLRLESEVAGDADLKAVRAERERVRRESSIAASDIAASPPKLVALQRTLISELAKLEKIRSTEELAVRKQYAAGLRSLKKQYAKKSMLDEALAVERELKQIVASIEGLSRSPSRLPSMRQGLILHLGFDRDEEGKVTDQGDRGHDASVNGATWTSKGKVRGDYEYDGDDYIEVGDLGEAPQEGTLAFWIYPAEMANYRNPFTTKRAGGNAGFRFEEHESGKFGIASGNDGGQFDGHRIAEKLVADQWFHVLIVWNMSENRMQGYLDGSEVFDEAHELWPTTFPNVALGTGFSTSGERQWKGKIDELMIWDRALSAAEVAQLYRTQK